MSYRVNRDIGYQPWGVTNPWVFANYGQPQRARGYVSPLVYTTQPPYLRSAHLNPRNPYFPSSHLGQTPAPDSAEARGARMERYALAGVLFGAVSLVITWQAAYRRGRMSPNRKRRSRSRRSR
jgi:hypothetical protein